MDSNEADEPRTNTDDTLALNKKRGRRVSFAAEMTSVHVFDRDDEDLETPPEPQPQPEKDDEAPRFFKDLEDDTEDGVEDSREPTGTDEEIYGVGRQAFLQPFESPSSASAFASATSNDEDDYFGPVSSEFIRPGRLSDSVASDDNREITMDSTAFSMHFRSLAKSDSGYLNTPTRSPVVFDEKTPRQSGTATAQGSSMELTRYDKSVPHISIPVDKFSSGKDSNDMSLLEDNPRKYDYARISPKLDELMSVGSKFPEISTSEFSNGISATESLVKNSSSTWIQNESYSCSDVPAADLGNPRVHASPTASDRVREELLASSHPLVQPSENQNQISIQHNTAAEISDVLDSNHVEAQIPSPSSGKLSEFSSPGPSFGRSTLKESNHFHSRGDYLKPRETTPKNDNSGQKCQPHSQFLPYPLSLVELSKDGHAEGRPETDISYYKAMPYQSPSVVISSMVHDLNVRIGMDASNTSGAPKLIPSEEAVSTSTDVRYSLEKKKMLGSILNGLASLSRTPVAGDSSLRSKLSSCIKKKPQHDMPVSRLENQFLGIDMDPNVQRRDDNGFTPSGMLGGSLFGQEVISTNLGRSSSKSKYFPGLKDDGVSSLNATLVDHSSIQSKLSSCIVKNSQLGTLVSRLEGHFSSIDQEHSFQGRIDVDENQYITTRDTKESPTGRIIKSREARENSYQLTTYVEQGPCHLSTLNMFSGGTATTPGDKLSSASVTHNDNTDSKLDETIKKILPSENDSVCEFPSRFEDNVHLELNQQSPADKVIYVSPDNGQFMDIISSESYINVVAPKLDNTFVEQNRYSRSPVVLIDQLRSPLKAHTLRGTDLSGLLHNTEFRQSPLKTDGNSDSSGAPFAPHAHASVDESPIMVQTPTKESSSSAFDEYVTNRKAPVSNVHKRGHDQIVTGDQHSAPNIPRSPKIPKKEINESLRLNICYDDESMCNSIVAPKHWSAIFSEALADSELSCSTSFNQLDLGKIKLLEDVLIQLQKGQTVTRICDSIQIQRVGKHYNAERNSRILKSKELLQNMMLERAKLKLIHAKREILRERLEIVRSGIKRCQTMKLNVSQLGESLKCNAKSMHCDPQSLTAQLEGQQNLQVATHEIPKMRQKLSATQRDIDALVYSFYTRFKLKEKYATVDTITFVNDHLKRRAVFKSLRADVQLWEINDMVYKNVHNKISLNYQDCLIQRFTLVAPISTVTVSYVLNSLNIEKKYPNMEAQIAFSYVFKEDVEQKHVGIRSLAQETQVTSSVFSNLVDVIEEVKLARLEFKHLKEAKFRSQPAMKLDLCLQFVDFKTGMKTDITLDVSCLSCGVYPSQVQPFPLMTTNSFPADLQATLEKLKLGSSRVLRICRSISEVLASARS